VDALRVEAGAVEGERDAAGSAATQRKSEAAPRATKPVRREPKAAGAKAKPTPLLPTVAPAMSPAAR
jgi:hypothetical protein